MRITTGARSDVGRVRRRNEDAYLVHEPLFAVADGMGGHRGGNVASTMSLEALDAADVEHGGLAAMIAAIREANRIVLARGEAERELAGMGTTVTAVLVVGDVVHVAHVGDSRAYLLRDGSISRITEDHTVVQEMVRRGRLRAEEAEHHPQRSILTRALGVDDDLEIDELALDLRTGDRILLCSDGLTGMVSDERIGEALGAAAGPQEACDLLVDLALEAGGEDNVTAVVLQAEGDGEGREAAAVVDAPDVGDARPHRRHRALWALVALLVIGLGGSFGVRAYVDRQWYVGESDGKVAVFNGVPASFLGIHLSHVATTTGIEVSDASKLPIWQGLAHGITAPNRAEAIRITGRILTDVCLARFPSCAAPEPPEIPLSTSPTP